MPGERIIPRFWSKRSPRWNFGDAISYFLYENLLIDFTPFSKRPWLIGSVLFDGAPVIEAADDNAALPSFLGDSDCEAVFWGCGLRDPGSLSAWLAERSAVLGVRGPLSSSDLKLGAEMPMGDPALFLPALYQPRQRKPFIGASVCVPHYSDERPDLEILAESGCDLVLRPAIEPNLPSLERFVDALCSARFVLCGALHGAIVAAAYGVPFGYWDSGAVDTPFKWEDFSALVGIPCRFHAKLPEAEDHFERAVRDSISIPSMWPLLSTAPAFIRPAGLMKVLRYELNRRAQDAGDPFDDLLEQLESKDWRLEHLASLSRQVTDQVVPTLVRERDAARGESAESSSRADQLAAEISGVRGEARALEAANADVSRRLDATAAELAASRARVDAQAAEHGAKLAAVEQELGRQVGALGDRIATLSDDRERLTQQLESAISATETATRALEAKLRHEQSEREAERARADDTEALLETERSDHGAALARQRALTQNELAAANAQLAAAIDRIGRLVRKVRSNKWARTLRKIPRIGKYDARLRRHADQILAFLATFSEAELGIAAAGREDRVLAYLFGLTSAVADMPLLDRNVYRTLHPDVAESKLDPFIHYLEFGQHEGRSPHPLLNHDYYTQRYPETARFDYSIIEHYLRFGAAKGYDPCDLFSTSAYLARYPDVRVSANNPLLHYLRNPGCQPHPDFDSDFYQTHYPDVVRAGFNPLTHFLLWGRAEGRRPIAGRPQSPQATQVHSRALPSPVSRSAVLPSAPRRPLVVMMEAFYPRPDEDSGSLDQINFVRIFQSLGYDVAFTALMDFAPDGTSKRALLDLGVECVTASDYVNVETYLFLNAERIAAFFLSRFNFGGGWIERARTFCPQAQVIFNTVDLHHLREERRALVEKDDVALENAQVTKAAELDRISAADITIVVSQTERDLLKTLTPGADVRVIPLIREVRERSFPRFEDRDGIAFVGGFQHQPNIDAVTTFLDRIWPEILSLEPAMRFYVIGSHMPDMLSRREDRNVEWVGYVPELDPWLDKVRLTVAPLRYGAGAKGKVVSSLLGGVPVVASQIAVEGMGLAEGDGIVTASDDADFARQVAALHRDRERWMQSSARGVRAVRDAYSLEHGIDLVGQILPRLTVA